MPAFRPLENKAMITMLVKQKETESMARVGLDQTRLAQRSFLFLSKRKPVISTSTLPQRLLRNLEDEQYVIPLWTGFFYNVSNDSNNFHQVAYLPMIADSPTKYSIIYEMLIQTKQKAESLNLEVQPPPIISSYCKLTVNRDQKGPGGTIRFSTTERTVKRWILTSQTGFTDGRFYATLPSQKMFRKIQHQHE